MQISLPFSQKERKKDSHSSPPQRTEAAQLDKVGPKAYISASWQPLYGPCVTSEHRVKEGGKPEYPEKNPPSQIEIDKSQPTCGAQDSIPGGRGGRREPAPT